MARIDSYENFLTDMANCARESQRPASTKEIYPKDIDTIISNNIKNLWSIIDDWNDPDKAASVELREATQTGGFNEGNGRIMIQIDFGPTSITHPTFYLIKSMKQQLIDANSHVPEDILANNINIDCSTNCWYTDDSNTTGSMYINMAVPVDENMQLEGYDIAIPTEYTIPKGAIIGSEMAADIDKFNNPSIMTHIILNEEFIVTTNY